MIGIDITKISRFQNMEMSLIKRFLHPNEIAEYLQNNNKPKFLAARWAIKEAIFKADNKFFSFVKIEIKKKNRVFVFDHFCISTSTEDELYIAFVMKQIEREK